MTVNTENRKTCRMSREEGCFSSEALCNVRYICRHMAWQISCPKWIQPNHVRSSLAHRPLKAWSGHSWSQGRCSCAEQRSQTPDSDESLSPSPALLCCSLLAIRAVNISFCQRGWHQTRTLPNWATTADTSMAHWIVLDPLFPVQFCAK